MNSEDLEPELASLRRARDAGMDEGAPETAFAEIDAKIALFEAEIRARHEGARHEDARDAE